MVQIPFVPICSPKSSQKYHPPPLWIIEQYIPLFCVYILLCNSNFKDDKFFNGQIFSINCHIFYLVIFFLELIVLFLRILIFRFKFQVWLVQFLLGKEIILLSNFSLSVSAIIFSSSTRTLQGSYKFWNSLSCYCWKYWKNNVSWLNQLRNSFIFHPCMSGDFYRQLFWTPLPPPLSKSDKTPSS